VKIAVVSAHYPPNFVSGGTLVPQRLAQGMHRLGHEVAVFAGFFSDTRAPLDSWPERDDGGLPIQWIVTTPWTEWANDRNYCNPEVTQAFADWLDDFAPDVVHFHSLQSLGAGLVEVATDRGIPTVVTLHDFWWWCARQFLVDREWCPCAPVVAAGVCACEVGRRRLEIRNAYLDRVLQRVDLVLAVSDSMFQVARANGVPAERLRVDENGIDDVPDVPVADARAATARVRLAYFGGPETMKGVTVLVAAVRQLGDLDGWCLSLYGCADWVAKEAGDLGAPNVLTPPPYDPSELNEVLSNADVVVVPSIMRESYSLVTREALVRGIPVVTSDCFGPEEVVTHEVNGLIVPTNDVDALAQALRRMVVDSPLRAKLAVSRSSVTLRTTKDQIQGLEALYREAIEHHSGTAPAAQRSVSRVLFMVGMDGAPGRYRTQLAAEGLRRLGVRADVRHYRHPDVLELSRAADALVVYRVPITAQVARVIDEARQRHIPVAFDADDLIFDPELADEIPALAILPAEEAALWLEGVERYRATLERCDAFIGSTAMLCEHATAVTGLPSMQWDNGVGVVTARLSDRALGMARRPGPLRLGYLSGSITHAHDWLMIEPAVVSVLDAHPDAELWLIGAVEPSDALGRFEHRIRREPFHDWRSLPSLLRDLDVNMAPLEQPNRFNEAKSAVKWLEAALVATPTVASPTEPFLRVVMPGSNGLLASTTEEWTGHLMALLGDASMRRRIGNRARRDALLTLAPDLQGRRYLQLLENLQTRDHSAAALDDLPDEPFIPIDLEPYHARGINLAAAGRYRASGQGTDDLAALRVLAWSIDTLIDLRLDEATARRLERT
jgi:glycosyltransferase involved in cell wall biosynthesis